MSRPTRLAARRRAHALEGVRRGLLITVVTSTLLLSLAVASPAGADDAACGDVSVDFAAVIGGPLTKHTQTAGPVAVELAAGTYDIVLTSFDPSHQSGKYLDQLHESWYFTLDNGFVSATTPDFGDELMGLSISQQGVTLERATQITAHWAGVEPSWDSVRASVTLRCLDGPPATTAPSSTVAPTTTEPVSTTVAPTSSVPATTAPATTAPATTAPATTAPATTQAPASTVAPPTTEPGGGVGPVSSLPPTSAAPTTVPATTSTTEREGEIGGITEVNPDLARTGGDLDLLSVGLVVLAAGVALVAAASVIGRRGATEVG